MKNGKVVFLILLVIVIWGFIGYKILSKVTDTESVTYPNPVKYNDVDQNKEEDYPLLFTYSDPFLKERFERKHTKIDKRKIEIVKIRPELVPISIDWSVVKYLGVLNNNTRSSATASLIINGEDVFLKRGETINGFLLDYINQDSVKIVYGTTFRYIKKEKN